MADDLIYRGAFAYIGGFPGLDNIEKGWVEVEQEGIWYLEQGSGRDNVKEVFSILGSEIDDVRHIEREGFFVGSEPQVVEVDVRSELGEFTIRLKPYDLGDKKNAVELLEAIEIVRSENSSDASVTVRRYSSPEEYQLDAPRMARRGWTVKDVTNQENRPGVARIATLGFGALVWKPKPTLVVTYTRDESGGEKRDPDFHKVES